MASEYENDIRSVGYQELVAFKDHIKAYIDALDATCSHLGHTHTSDEVYDEGYIKRFTNPFDIRRLHNYNVVLKYTKVYGNLVLNIDTYGAFFFDLMGPIDIELVTSTNNDNADSKADPNDLSKTFARKLDFYINSNGFKVVWPENVEWIVGSNKLAANKITHMVLITPDNGETWYGTNLTYAADDIDITIDGVQIATNEEVEEMLDEEFGVYPGVGGNPDTERASGSLIVNGDLDADLSVIGNIEVSGNISGKVNATGVITYGSLTGTAQQGLTLRDFDISVENGAMTFLGDVSTVDGMLFTEKTLMNDTGTTSIISCDIKVNTTYLNAFVNENGNVTLTNNHTLDLLSSYSTGRGFYNNGTNASFTLEEGSTIISETTGANSRGVYNYNAKEFIINGLLKTTGTSYGIYNNTSLTVNGELYAYSEALPFRNNNGTIGGVGKIYINDILYYDGSKD